jgi:pimeloyl-ACP methyl ester carboxylesterase
VSAATTPANAALRRHLSAAVATAQLSDPEPDLPTASSARKRARVEKRADSHLATVALVQDEDILRWIYDPPPTTWRRRGRRRGVSLDDEDVVDGFQFLEVPPNKVIGQLERLDDAMTPDRGLRQWVNGRPSARKTLPDGRVLLLVHGTFSRGDMFAEELSATPHGQQFLATCEHTYDAVVTFDHPTLALAPWLNALDLARATATARGPIEVVCHSRGGLVVAWWLLIARPPVTKVVFVGSPLEGTSLAAPARMKSACDLLGNYARALATLGNAAATVVPMLAFAGGLMKLIGGVASFAASTPLLDAGVALVPGLAAQSRVGNNFELQRLFSDSWITRHELHAIVSNYEPPATSDPVWQFWKHFRTLPERAVNSVADAIFDGPNDLVVDTRSMTRLGERAVRKSRRLEFEGAVHHCGYFREAKTLDYLQTAFKL